MRKRPTPIVGLAVAIAAAVVASAAIAAHRFRPGRKHAVDRSEVVAEEALEIDADPRHPERDYENDEHNAANGVPVPAVKAVVDFDKNTKLFTKGVPTCDPAKLQNTSTEIALRECGKAKIGGGKRLR